jgi:hypothetical protein
MPALTPDDPEYDRDGYLPLDRVEDELEHLRETFPERKARKAALLAALDLAEVDGNAFDDGLRFEIGSDDGEE